jgi:hypothetical protein
MSSVSLMLIGAELLGESARQSAVLAVALASLLYRTSSSSLAPAKSCMLPSRSVSSEHKTTP